MKSWISFMKITHARPDTGQKVVYNGNKRVHGLKFQSLTLPNGVIGKIFGPVGELFIYIILSFTITRTQCEPLLRTI